MKNNKVPTLRFKSEKSEWSWKYLKDISKKITDKNKDNQYTETLTNSAELGIINQRDYFDKDISNKNNLNGYYIVKPDDFVYNPRISIFAPVGPIKRNKLGRTGVMSPLYYVFRTQHIDLAYLEAYFSSVKWHLYMKQNGDSGARSDRFSIKDSVFGEMPIPYPSKEIQKKIGSFFKNLDDTISLHQQELEALKKTKQGFLQKMFPKDGETVPEIRFSASSEPWNKKELGALVKKIKSYSLSRDVETNEDSGYKYVHYGDIHKNVAKYIDEFSNLPNIREGKYEYLEEGDLVLADASEDYKGIANAAIVALKPAYKLIAGLHTIALRPDTRNLNSLFLYYLFESSIFKKYGYKAGTGMKVFGISATNLLKFNTIYPKIEEQIEIGKFFRQLDEVIELKEKELEALKETKKGFLQKMFV